VLPSKLCPQHLAEFQLILLLLLLLLLLWLAPLQQQLLLVAAAAAAAPLVLLPHATLPGCSLGPCPCLLPVTAALTCVLVALVAAESSEACLQMQHLVAAAAAARHLRLLNIPLLLLLLSIGS
jgi:hypothetical protein